MRHCEAATASHVVACGRANAGAVSTRAFLALMIYPEHSKDLCPECVRAIVAVAETWLKETGHGRGWLDEKAG